jgi:putative FmdB family regulatory protein
MPRYCYHCDACGHVFEKFHSMSEKVSQCISCEKVDQVRRVPAGFRILTNDGADPSTKVGDVVKKHIEEAKEEVKKEKQEMSQEYEP